MTTSEAAQWKREFGGQGYVVLPKIARADDLVSLRGAFRVRPDSSLTQVQGLAPGQVSGLAVFAAARSAVTSVCGGPLGLEFAQWYCKGPNTPSASIPWHQDRAFWSEHRPHTVTAWIALDAVRTANGCLSVVPGSHLALDVRSHGRKPGSATPTCDVLDREPQQELEVAEGTCVLYHERLVHRSGGNGTAEPRRALVLGWGLPDSAID